MDIRPWARPHSFDTLLSSLNMAILVRGYTRTCPAPDGRASNPTLAPFELTHSRHHHLFSRAIRLRTRIDSFRTVPSLHVGPAWMRVPRTGDRRAVGHVSAPTPTRSPYSPRLPVCVGPAWMPVPWTVDRWIPVPHQPRLPYLIASRYGLWTVGYPFHTNPVYRI